MNKVILTGRLTRDIQLSYTPSNTAVAEIGLAVNEKRKQQDGSYKDIAHFIDCVCFGKRAEALNRFLSKGDPILIEGKLQYESWQAKDGTKRSKLKVNIDNFEFIGGKKNEQQGNQQDDTPF